RKGLLAYHHLHDAIKQVERVRFDAREFFEEMVDWKETEGGPNGRVRAPLKLPGTLGAELDRLAAAIPDGVEHITRAEQRIELSAAEERCRTLAASLRGWVAQELPR